MTSQDLSNPDQCPELLSRRALLLSFRALRGSHPSLALRVRNALGELPMDEKGLPSSSLPPKTVHEVVSALSSLSKHRDRGAVRLVTLRKLLLVWMEYELAQIKAQSRG